MKKKLFSCLTAPITILSSSAVSAAVVPLQQPTATYSQIYLGNWGIANAVDGSLNTGWAVQRANGYATAETAAFETAYNLGFVDGTQLTFELSFAYPDPSIGFHTLGRFRLSVTSDDRSTFADGLASGGDVTANWTVLDPVTYFATNGAVLARLPDGSILASGANAIPESYVIIAETTLTNITGVRLETLYDGSLPHSGPGRASNGNFVLDNFAVSADVLHPDLKARIEVSYVDILWAGLTNKWYQVQYSSTLSTNYWVNLGGPVQGNGTNFVTDSVRGSQHKYYRVIYAP